MKKPIIGIVMRSFEENGRSGQYVYEGVRRAIIQNGGIPFLLTPVGDLDYFKTRFDEFDSFSLEEEEQIQYFLSMCDGLFMPGGNKFTKYDKYVYHLALQKNMPILGVCLGMQVMSYSEDSKR